MIITLLILLVVFVLTWFAALPSPFWLILVVVEGVALLLAVVPYAPLRGGLW